MAPLIISRLSMICIMAILRGSLWLGGCDDLVSKHAVLTGSDVTGIGITIGFGSHIVINTCIRQWRVVYVGWMAGLSITGSVIPVPVNPLL
jgi:hypothetical protein